MIVHFALPLPISNLNTRAINRAKVYLWGSEQLEVDRVHATRVTPNAKWASYTVIEHQNAQETEQRYVSEVLPSNLK